MSVLGWMVSGIILTILAICGVVVYFDNEDKSENI